MHIGHKIKQIFDTSGMSVSELARRIQTTRQNVYGIFERSSIDTALLDRISIALNYDFFKLFVKKTEMAAAEKQEDYTSQRSRMVLQIEISNDNLEEILKLSLGDEIKESLKKILK